MSLCVTSPTFIYFHGKCARVESNGQLVIFVVILWNSCGSVAVLTANKYSLLSWADNFNPGL